MKRYIWLVTLALAGTLAVVGCGKKSGVDTDKLQRSFKSAEPAAQSDVDKAVTAVQDGKYSEAMAYLNKVASKAQLTPEQEAALRDTIAQIQKQISAGAEKAAGDMQKSADDLKKSLPLGK